MFRPALLAAVVAVFTMSPVRVLAADSDIYKKIAPAVQLILTDEGEGMIGRGTGFVVDKPNGLMTSNHHVINTAREIRVYLPEYRNGKLISDWQWYWRNGKSYAARVVHTDPSRDLAVLKVDGLPKSVGELPLADASATAGEEVYTVGHPSNAKAMWIGHAGVVQSVKFSPALLDNGQKFRAVAQKSDLQVYRGASGSPVVNEAGEVVGVVSHGKFDKATKEAEEVSSVDVSELRKVIQLAKEKLAAEKDAPKVPPHAKPRYFV